ncbi:MAG TPA: helix-turn-helix domain-containing protein [Candidatus Lokiarchaeia archaeon]|nr:helix-turn-helix domain-containing protein [Candidatus Lokiarchaeia archaeon]
MQQRPRSSKRNYDQEILKCLEDGVIGLTVTDIANTLGISRNTVSKYLRTLETQQLVSSQDVGVYRLYFVKIQGALPRAMLNSIFWGVLAGLKKVFPDYPEMFKKVGGEIDKNISFPLIGGNIEEIVEWLRQITNEQFFEAIAILLPRIFFIAENARVKSFTIEEGRAKATYLVTNAILLQNENYLYSLYIMAGFLESYFKSKYKKEIACDIVDCKFSELPSDAYVKIAIEILK